jgi:tetratricopeptide (TPR) repeat protein
VVSGWNLLGRAEGELGRLGRAEAIFRQAIDLAGPDHGADARANLGVVFEKRGDWDGARQQFEVAARISSNHRFARQKLAMLEERQGNLEAALRWWEELRGLLADPTPADRQIARLRQRLETELRRR